MAEGSILWSQDQFSCPICLDLLKDPVTIPCGHSYCMSCITDCWDQEDQRRVYSCPQCRQTFTPKPALNKNVVLAETLENLRNPGVWSEAGDVECDVCIGRKRKAVKSCLVCLESYCQSHFECHEVFRSAKRHKVTDATGRLQERVCSQHERLLEVFCRTDQSCVCLMCVMDGHKNHDTVSAAAERREKQKQVKDTQTKLQETIQKRQKDLQELREAVDSQKSSAQTAVEDFQKVFAELIRSIERSRSELIQLIRDQEKAAVRRAEGLLKDLEQEIDELKKRDAELEQLSHTEDHVYFLQGFLSLSTPPESTNSISVSSHICSDDVRQSVLQLRRKFEDFFKEEMEKISAKARHNKSIFSLEPNTRNEFLQDFHQFTLDSDTVHKLLCLSEENTVAACTDTVQPYPDHPDRFECWPQVLCKESVCGRCYWEVDWTGRTGVGISVSYKSISRKGRGQDSKFGYNDHSWRLFCSPAGYLFSHNSMKTNLPVVSGSSRVGVFVDHRAGTLSFYSVSDTMTLIHRVQTTFTQPLYAGFGINKDSSVKLCHLTAVSVQKEIPQIAQLHDLNLFCPEISDIKTVLGQV